MKFLNEFLKDVRNGENIDVYFTLLVCIVVVALDVFGIVEFTVVTAAILLTLGLLSFGTLATRKTLEGLNNSLQKLGGTGIEVLEMKTEFPQQIAQRTRVARKFILDTNLNEEVPHSPLASPQEEYRRIRDERVMKGEIVFRRVEVIYHRKHFESVLQGLLMFEGCEFYLRHYDPPAQVIPVLHLMSFDGEHFYLGGFYPSGASIEEKAVYIRNDEVNAWLREYWQLLWQRAKPLNDGRIINWEELKRIGERFGIVGEEFDGLVSKIKSEVESSKRQMQRRK